MKYLDDNGRIPTYKVQNEYALLEKLPDQKPSKRIIQNKYGLKAIKALIDLEKKENVSWYSYLKKRNVNNMDELALFYRGNKIPFNKMFEEADKVAKSMKKNGLESGDEIGVCVSNTPELVYILLAANKLSIKVNIFGANYNNDFINEIMNDLSNKMLFISDDNYEMIKDNIKSHNFNKIVVSSLADSLPEDVTKCDEYEPELDKYYHFEDHKNNIQNEISNVITFQDFELDGENYPYEILDEGNLETDFLVTYTSGSTKIGFPKALIHKNRSLITMGRFHDPELCGNPKIPGLRGLAHIHPDSNTNIITCISDNLIQGWSVALEPEYDQTKALDYVFLNKPNYLNATTSFLIEMSKQYLLDKKFHQNGKGRKLPFLLAAFAVGEGTQKGEEKFINKFLRESRAGSGVSMMGLKLPFTTLSIGGGDCEHGGIYYTLWKSLYQKLYFPKIGKQDMGLLPVPFVQVTCLKKDENGKYVECDYEEPGTIVANSYTNMSGYKNNPEETNEIILEDNLGRKWVSCKTYGYIDKIGGVHVKGRASKKENTFRSYIIDDVITKDTKNILSSTSVMVDDKIISTVQQQPNSKNNQKLYFSMYQRLLNDLGKEIADSIYIRNIPIRESYPLTGAGKRSVRDLEKMKAENTFNLHDYVMSTSKKKEQNNTKKILKKRNK